MLDGVLGSGGVSPGTTMGPNLRLHVKPSLRLRLTPQVKLSLALLQTPAVELTSSIEQVLAENPFLETEEAVEEESLVGERDPASDPYDAIDQVPSKTSLQEDLLEQLCFAVSSPEELRVGEAILGHLSSQGYLGASVQEIAHLLGVSEETVSHVLAVIQSLEPAGVGAQDLRECLLIQLKARGQEGSLAWHLVDECLEELGRGRFGHIAKRLAVSPEAVQKAAQEIGTLDPKPGRAFGNAARPIVPDLSVERHGEGLLVKCPRNYLPRLKINADYASLLDFKRRDHLEAELKRLYGEAKGFVQGLQFRERTLVRLAQALLVKQAGFFEKGPAYLKSLTARDLALTLGCHESTVSRAISEKYMATPFGLFPLPALFPRKAVLATGEEALCERLKQMIQEVLESESREKPFSDQDIVTRLQARGLSPARRTVAKYRAGLGIFTQSLRKKYPPQPAL